MEKKVTREEVERVIRKHSDHKKVNDEILNELFLPESDSVNYKLKHLSLFCCEPANELEFEAVKMAAEIGGVEFYDGNFFGDCFTHFAISSHAARIVMQKGVHGERTEIPVLNFCNKLRMTEQEAEKLEDDRVVFSEEKNRCKWSDYGKTLMALNGHYFKTNEDGTEVTLHKR